MSEYICNSCNAHLVEKQIFCPNCGEKFDGLENHTTSKKTPRSSIVAKSATKTNKVKKLPFWAILLIVFIMVFWITVSFVFYLSRMNESENNGFSLGSEEHELPTKSPLDVLVENETLPGWARGEAMNIANGQWYPNMETYDAIISTEQKREAFYTAFVKNRGELFSNFESTDDMRDFVKILKNEEAGSLSANQATSLNRIIGRLRLHKLPTDRLSVCSIVEEAIKYYEK